MRIYECLEQPSLASWQLLQDIDVLTLPTTTPSSRSNAHTVTSATPTQTSAGLDGNSVSAAAHVLQQQASQSQLSGRPGLGTREADGGWCISWCKDKYWGEVIAAGCGIEGVVKVRSLRSWSCPSFPSSARIRRSSNSTLLVARPHYSPSTPPHPRPPTQRRRAPARFQPQMRRQRRHLRSRPSHGHHHAGGRITLLRLAAGTDM